MCTTAVMPYSRPCLVCLWQQGCSSLFIHNDICKSLCCILDSMPAQEVLPVGMHVHCVGSGHAKLTFKGYYTAVLTLAEAPGAQAEPPCQPGPPQQGEPVQGQPLQQPGHPQQQQPGHLQQQQPGANEPKDVDQQADEVTSGCMRTVSQDDKVGPHEEKYRWRLLSFDILPGTAAGPADTLVQSCQLHADFPQATSFCPEAQAAKAQNIQKIQKISKIPTTTNFHKQQRSPSHLTLKPFFRFLKQNALSFLCLLLTTSYMSVACALVIPTQQQ